MTKYAVGLGLALALSLAVAAVAEDKEKKEKKEDKELVAARKDTVDLAELYGKDPKDFKKEDVVKKVSAIRKAHELDLLMKAYKPKESGGIGFGGAAGKANGIENKITALQRYKDGKGPSVAELKKDEADLVKMGLLNLAMAEIVKPYFKMKMKGKDKADWEKYADNQKAAAEEFIKAVKKHDGPAVAKAAKNLLGSCTDCHSAFRTTSD